jgi:hypothetical protein
LEKFINIRAGKIENPQGVRKAIAALPEGRYLMVVEKKNKRSTQQNRYYFGCVLPIVLEGLRDAGWKEFEDAEEVHECLKHKFLKKHVANADGEAMEKIASTKKLSTVEFNEYIENIAQWAAEYLNVYIPPPASQSKLYQHD